MKKKPVSINLIAFAYFVAPLFNMWQIAWINHWPYFGPRSVFHHLTWIEYAILGCFPIVALGIFRVNRWGYYFFLGFSAFLIVYNSWLYFQNPAYSRYVVLLYHLLTIGVVGFFLRKHIIAPYFNPKLRWWLRDPRYQVSLSAGMRFGQDLFTGKVIDLSVSGCFVQTERMLEPGQMLWLNLIADNLSFTALAKVVWASKYAPKGFGLMFLGLGKAEKQHLQRIIDSLTKASKKSSSNQADLDAA